MQAFEEALAKTCSPKEQKQQMKGLLLLAAGTRLKALASHKSTNVITNVSGKFLHLVKSFSWCDVTFVLPIVFMNVLHFSHLSLRIPFVLIGSLYLPLVFSLHDSHLPYVCACYGRCSKRRNCFPFE